MPERFFGAEVVFPSASITQITDVSSFATAGPFTLQVKVDVAVQLAVTDISRAFYCFPAFSAHGEVRVVAWLYLTVAVFRSPTAVTLSNFAQYDAVSVETLGPWTNPSQPRPVVFVPHFLVSDFTPSVELSVMLPVSPPVVFGGGPVGGGPGGPFPRPDHRIWAWATVTAEAVCLIGPEPDHGMSGVNLRDKRTSPIFADGLPQLEAPIVVDLIRFSRYGP